uniref:Uncharacterized protein n=1 Tax=Rhizophora mucronata TaxID=61149 RepID=A0A2P2Q7Q7_RHIMU
MSEAGQQDKKIRRKFFLPHVLNGDKIKESTRTAMTLHISPLPDYFLKEDLWKVKLQ